MSAKADRRNMIIERLVELCSSVSIPLLGDKLNGPITLSSQYFVHNRGELPAEKVPGLVLLDADEVKDPRVLAAPPGRKLPVSPCLMRMTPEIYVVLNVRKPNNENVSEDLNTVRAALLNLIMHDAVLLTILGDNGQISYDGCITDLARNRTMRGQMGLSITFIYPWLPGEFIGA